MSVLAARLTYYTRQNKHSTPSWTSPSPSATPQMPVSSSPSHNKKHPELPKLDQRECSSLINPPLSLPSFCLHLMWLPTPILIYPLHPSNTPHPLLHQHQPRLSPLSLPLPPGYSCISLLSQQCPSPDPTFPDEPPDMTPPSPDPLPQSSGTLSTSLTPLIA